MKNSLGIIFLAAFLATGFCASSAFAQTSTSTESLILDLQSQIKALQTRINELETELGVKQAPPTSPDLPAGKAGATQPSSETSAGTAQDKQLSAPSTQFPIFTTTLSLGSRGDDVRNLQTFLAQLPDTYPEGLITGYYGPLTEKAVQRWQAKEGIVVSGSSETTGYGRIGPKTRARLNDLAVSPPSKPPSKKENAAIPSLPSTATSTPPQIGTTTPIIIPTPVATTTPSTATTTPSGTIPATPAQPIGQTGTTTVPATPATPTGGTGGTTPPPSPTPSPTPPPSTATTTPPTSPPPPSTTDTIAPTIFNPIAWPYSPKITWYTDESADGKVEYGLTTSYGSTAASSTLKTYHEIYLSNLSSNTLYHYRMISKDAAGNTTTSGDSTFTSVTVSTPPPPPPPSSDTTTPTISNVQIEYATETVVQIRWETNEPADGQIEYGLTTSYGSQTNVSIWLVQGHSFMPIIGLTPNTLYHFRVKSKDAAGNLAISSDHTFTTLNVQANNITDTSATIIWITNDSMDGKVEYGLTTSYGNSVISATFTTSHSILISNLQPSTIYHYRVISKNAAWTSFTSWDYTFTTSASSSAIHINKSTLASILQSLSTTLDDIQKQIQKLAR